MNNIDASNCSQGMAVLTKFVSKNIKPAPSNPPKFESPISPGRKYLFEAGAESTNVLNMI